MGTGEVLEALNENLRLSAVIFFPEWSADTAGAYRVLDEARTLGRAAITGADEAGEEAASVLERLKDGRRVGTLPNDFVTVAGHESQYGMLSGLSSAYGALAWGLCGSGSAYFSLFRPGDSGFGIKSIAETIRKKEKNEFKWLRQILVLE
jgi:4-diphosphocytidyl-2-C-methyl-D-erythritol kinase